MVGGQFHVPVLSTYRDFFVAGGHLFEPKRLVYLPIHLVDREY
jgi:hypothetical protein